jgi:tetratricopeptide (TPR) repeat protein
MRTAMRKQSRLVETPNESVQKALGLLREHPGLAEAVLLRSVKKYPDHLATLQVLGVIQQRIGKHKEAEENFRKLVELDPTNSENYANLGTALGGLGRHEEAVEAMEKSVQMDPKKPMFKNNLAIQYEATGRYEDAKALLEEALREKQTAQLWDNLGNLYVRMEDYESAKNCYLTAISLDNRYVPSQINLGLVHHFQGDYMKGFAQYEWRFLYYPELRPYVSWYDLSKMWDGKASLEGKRVLVYGEQGIGDIIMFSRYLKAIKDKGAYVMFHVPSSLNGLLAGLEGFDELVNIEINTVKTDPLPEYDYQFPLMSAPHLLNVGPMSSGSYIKDVPTDFRKLIKEQCPDTFNVGVVWRGNIANPDNDEKSVPLSELMRLQDIKDVKLFSLQIDGEEETKACGLPDMSEFITDFADTARVIHGMDLLICCDTAVSHVAGATGFPVWNLIRYGPDWRWPFRRPAVSGTHWYGSMTLFHQQEKGNWSKVVDKVYEELEKKTGQSS